MDHAKSQQAREFLRTYVNGNRKLITDWLNGFAAMISGEAGKVVMDWGVASSQNTQGVKVVAV
ncbi:MAG: hypothetical protein CMN36_04480, partial [SAR116 cluster bacterium]|nr:hypothetical protein [SAR116 cluster bacterium]